MSSPRLLVEGDTCWRLAEADRVAFLIDGEAYFGALAAALERAQRSIVALGWDFHSRIRLRRDGEAADEELAALLDSLARRRRRLRIHLLEWDFAMIYALEREVLPLYRFGLQTHRRLHFRLDDRHPLGASHHQKIVVVDDQVAFCGGFDLATCRWDTRAHRANDPRRSDPGFDAYAPFHDVQMVVDGAAAAALGELARGRWRRATGQRIGALHGPGDAWPPELEPDLRDVQVGIARTDPAHDGRDEVREVERLYTRAIRGARHSIYIENQYFTSRSVVEALAERLRDESGPEVVLVLPKGCSGWLEEKTMGLLRARALRRLQEADAHGRFRVYHPVLPDVDPAKFTVHSKVLVVDDRMLRIGSANLSNRSMGLDTECDLAIESCGDERVGRAITLFRDDLLGEHLGVEPEKVGRQVEASRSLVGAVEALRGGPRSLEPLGPGEPDWLEEILPESLPADPERPIELDRLVASLTPEELPQDSRPAIVRVAVGALLLLGLAALWRATPLGEWVSAENLAALAEPMRAGPAGRALALGIFVLGGLTMVPVTGLVVASSLVFGWREGALVALVGASLSAAAGYLAGRTLWRDAVRRLAGRRLLRLSRRVAQRGIFAMATLRLVPVAPFTVVNLVAGASHLTLRDYLIGTVLGMAPGILALTYFADRTLATLRDPSGSGLAWLAVLAAVLVAVLMLLRRLLAGRSATERM